MKLCISPRWKPCSLQWIQQARCSPILDLQLMLAIVAHTLHNIGTPSSPKNEGECENPPWETLGSSSSALGSLETECFRYMLAMNAYLFLKCINQPLLFHNVKMIRFYMRFCVGPEECYAQQYKHIISKTQFFL